MSSTPHPFITDHHTEIAAQFETWFADHQRNLPWRLPLPPNESPLVRMKHGYFALVSEAMLQQTQVSRVIEYFDRFVQHFPTVQALADAPEQEVLAQWQGLGYYRRARNLQAAAKIIVADFNGIVPRNIEDLRKLPGIGRYTAGAIASIGYGERTPLVDGNVKRVLTRLLAYPDSTETRAGENLIWETASELVDASNEPGMFNQALMELGSLICLPKRPRCEACPVRGYCQAQERGLVSEIPPPKKPPKQQDLFAASIVIRNSRGHWLLLQRPKVGLWASLYETPTLESPEKKRIGKVAVTKFLRDVIGLQAAVGGLLKTQMFIHQTSHRKVHFTVWELTNYTGRKKVGQWVAPKNLNTFPISNAQRKVLGI